jgi:putative transposase
LEEKISKAELARRLGISRASLYYKPKIPDKDEQLRQAIEIVMINNPGYGHRRIALALNVNRKRVQRVMRLFNLKPARRCKTPNKPEDLGKEALNFPDITRLFCPIAPNALWVSDFTFISYRGNFIFLATILDRLTAEVLGANVMSRHTSELPHTALLRALQNTDCLPHWCHSDQGSEYNSDRFLSELANYNIEVSMSPKASPWRNGAQESFFGRFKVEFGDPERFETLPELIEAIYGFINLQH